MTAALSILAAAVSIAGALASWRYWQRTRAAIHGAADVVRDDAERQAEQSERIWREGSR